MLIQGLSKPFWAAADDGGQGAGGGDEVAATADAGQNQGDQGGESGQGESQQGDGEAQPGKSSILDFAPKGEAAEGEGGEKWALPEGLDVPDHLLGTSAEDTLKKLSTAYKGARQELSTRKRADGVLEGEVPKDIEGYTFEGDAEKDPILKDLTSEESKPIVDAWRAAALEVGIPNAAFAKFMQTGIAKMQEGGLQLSADPEESARINGEAEMESLTQMLGKDGADMALRQLDTFAQKLANNGILSSKDDVAEFGQMVGTARAAQIMQRIITAEFGERAIPPGDAIDGAPTIEEAYEMQRQANSIKDMSERQEAVARADAALAKAMRKGSIPGQVRSRVL